MLATITGCADCSGLLLYGAVKVRRHKVCTDCVLRGVVRIGNTLVSTRARADTIRRGWRRHQQLWEQQFNHPTGR
jgi:hypothetical protein